MSECGIESHRNPVKIETDREETTRQTNLERQKCKERDCFNQTDTHTDRHDDKKDRLRNQL